MTAATAQIAAFLPELTVGAGVLLVLAVGIIAPRRNAAGISLLSLAVLAAALGILLWQMTSGPDAPPAVLGVPGAFGALFRVMALLAASVTVLLSHDYVRRAGIAASEYCLLILLATLGMMFTAGSGSLLLLFLGIELMSLSFVLLTGLGARAGRSKEAALKYLLYGLTASALLLFGLSLVYGLYASWDLEVIAARAAAGDAGPAGALAMVLLLAGLGFKVGLVPFHMWIPDVYDGAPAPVAAFLSVGPKAAAWGAAATFLVGAFGGLAATWHPLLWGMAVLSMIWGNAAALAQRNLKRMLAYSSIAQAGYLGVGLLASVGQPEEGLGALAFYLFTYLFFNLGAFTLAVWREGEGGRGPDLDDLAGLGRRQPWLGGAWAVCCLGLAGIPPTAGFMAKLWVFLAAVQAGMTALAVVGVLASVLGAFYYLRVVWYLFFREPAAEGGAEPVPWNIGFLGLALCALATLWFGVWPGPLLELAQRVAAATF